MAKKRASQRKSKRNTLQVEESVFLFDFLWLALFLAVALRATHHGKAPLISWLPQLCEVT
jgi:hypothetical protein